jgi:hypothetical protein
MLTPPTSALIMPDDMPAHPYAVCMEVADLAPIDGATVPTWPEEGVPHPT